MPKIKLSNPIREEFRISMIPPVKKNKGRKLVHKVVHIRMNPTIWRAAMEIAENDALRIEIISADEVIVHNSRGW